MYHLHNQQEAADIHNEHTLSVTTESISRNNSISKFLENKN